MRKKWSLNLPLVTDTGKKTKSYRTWLLNLVSLSLSTLQCLSIEQNVTALMALPIREVRLLQDLVSLARRSWHLSVYVGTCASQGGSYFSHSGHIVSPGTALFSRIHGANQILSAHRESLNGHEPQ